MFDHAQRCTLIARLRARRYPAAARRANPIGDTMSTALATRQSAAPSRRARRCGAAAIMLLATIALAFVPLVGFTTTAAQFSLELSLDVAEQEVQAAINAANNLLPSDLPIPPVYAKINPADAPILTLAVTSKTMSLTDLRI